MPVPELFEIVLRVKDVAVSAAFYREAVGLTPRWEPTEDWAGFWCGDPASKKWLGLNKRDLLFEEHSPLPEGARFGPVHFALYLPPDQIEPALARLRGYGVEVLGPHRFKSSDFHGLSYYFYDPDANLVEFWFPEPNAAPR
ncbi:MAG: VOC family protein [Fimbriimonas ginsengisoli]|uniref:VOC family protein n=1 Tax=Fimbriimonas ginsengisoli TaxID=1005039 RepID=A0A931PUW6_FIMGI|nr:VOC family protein [Fimbriimonas ginsengisoli]MBI3721264.1 VOC family protein [Fimbriimonas ginsengisoli]